MMRKGFTQLLNRHRLRILISVACLIPALSTSLAAQANLPVPLSTDAKEIVDKGIAASKLYDHLLAIQYFEEARKIAPDAPAVFFNLGLAESKVPARELRAIAWFGAYLAAAPDSPASTVTAVRQQMSVLSAKNQANLARLLNNMQDAAGKFSGYRQRVYMSQVAKMWAEAGDFAAAQRAAAMIPTSEDSSSFAHYYIFKAQLKAGDLSGAEKSVKSISHNSTLSRAREELASARKLATAVARGEIAVETHASRWSALSDWLSVLDISGIDNDCPLNNPMFKDLDAYLKRAAVYPLFARPANFDESSHLHDVLYATSRTIISSTNVIAEMVKQQARR